MNWKALGGKLIGLGLEVAGGALLGPAGKVAGKVIADALGVDAEPEIVSREIDARGDEAWDTIKEAEASVEMQKAYSDFMRAAATEVGETMRMELAQGTPMQRLWRPVVGFVFAFNMAVLALTVAYAVVRQDVAVLTALISLSGFLVILISTHAAVVGVYVWKRTEEKESTVGGLLEGLFKR